MVWYGMLINFFGVKC